MTKHTHIALSVASIVFCGTKNLPAAYEGNVSHSACGAEAKNLEFFGGAFFVAGAGSCQLDYLSHGGALQGYASYLPGIERNGVDSTVSLRANVRGAPSDAVGRVCFTAYAYDSLGRQNDARSVCSAGGSLAFQDIVTPSLVLRSNGTVSGETSFSAPSGTTLSLRKVEWNYRPRGI